MASTSPTPAAATCLAALLGLYLLVTAGASSSLGPVDSDSGGDDLRGLLAFPVNPRKLMDFVAPHKQQHQRRKLLGVGSSTGVVEWKLSECDISKSNEVTCPEEQANACCDGSGCASWANNEPVKCVATRFIGCCGAQTKRSAVDWSLSMCTVNEAEKTGTCPTNKAEACCDGDGCSSWGNAGAVSCSGTTSFGCCGK